MKKYISYLVKVLITIGSILIIAKGLDFASLAEEFIKYDYSILTCCIILMLCQNLFGGLRWWYCCYIRKLDHCQLWCIKIQMIGVFVAQLFPGTLGLDGYRLMQSKWHGSKVSSIITTLLQEKFFSFASLGILVILFTHQFLDSNVVVKTIYSVSLITTCVVFSLPAFNLAIRRITYYYKGMGARYLQAIIDVMVVPYSILLKGIMLGVFSNAILVGVYSILWFNIFGLWPSTSEFVLFLPLILLTSLPISFGGWGLREGSLLLLFNEAPASLVSIGVAFGLIQTIAALPGGIGLILSTSQLDRNRIN